MLIVDVGSTARDVDKNVQKRPEAHALARLSRHKFFVQFTKVETEPTHNSEHNLC